MNDTAAVRLDPDGPHSPDYTRAVADTLRESVRVLNHATLPASGYPGLTYPADVYDVLGALDSGAQGLSQLALHLSEYLAREMQAGRIAVTYGNYEGDPLGAVSVAVNALTAAGAAAEQLQAALSRAHEATSAMSAADVEGGE